MFKSVAAWPLNKTYEVTWTFDYPPPPLLLSTWLLNDPLLIWLIHVVIKID